MKNRIASMKEVMLLLAHDPGNDDYLALYDAAAAVATARSDLEISEAEYRELSARIAARLKLMAADLEGMLKDHRAADTRVVGAQAKLRVAEISQRYVEIQRGIGE